MDLYQLVRRLLPRTLRTNLRRVLQQALPPSEDVELLKIRMNNVEASIFHLAPPEILITEEVERHIQQFRDDYGIDGELEVSISKRDVMFRYLEYFRGSLPAAYWEYLATGYRGFQTFDRLVDEYLGGYDGIDAVLDFASGYGRISRFLAWSAGPDQIWVSDIKPRAVDFQRDKLGVHGFVSPPDAADFPAELCFDAIFVASFFTHLPEHAFGEWLRVLCNALSDRGFLAFSVNGMEMRQGDERSDFYYRAISEEALFPYLDDDPPGGDAYGETYVSESFVRSALAKLDFPAECVQRHPQGMWDIQDLYVVTRSGAEDTSAP